MDNSQDHARHSRTTAQRWRLDRLSGRDVFLWSGRAAGATFCDRGVMFVERALSGRSALCLRKPALERALGGR
eukprot:15063177-Alexandrium_andersonii.AAC.1